MISLKKCNEPNFTLQLIVHQTPLITMFTNEYIYRYQFPNRSKINVRSFHFHILQFKKKKK